MVWFFGATTLQHLPVSVVHLLLDTFIFSLEVRNITVSQVMVLSLRIVQLIPRLVIYVLSLLFLTREGEKQLIPP
jgi:hypothetical protein